MSDSPNTSATDVRRAEYRFGDDTTTVAAPETLSVRLAPEEAQPDSQDTASFLVHDAQGSLAFEVTASHFSSGNRSANMSKYRAIIEQKLRDARCPQVVVGDINTEVSTAQGLQQLADETGLVVLVPSLQIRRLRGLQDQLHKRMDGKEDDDSMFVAIDPGLVDAAALAEVPHQNMAWPHQPTLLRWEPPGAEDVAQAWMDDRILTDHGVLKCPLAGGEVVSLANAARANYDKYNIKNQARITRRVYLEGQRVIEIEVATAVIQFVAALPPSATLAPETKATALLALERYRDGLEGRYQDAFDRWEDADDLCTPTTPLGLAIKELGLHSGSFVRIVRTLSWEDVRDAPAARATFAGALTDALVEGLGVGSADASRPLGGHPGFDAVSFRAGCEAKIEAAWERIIKRRSAGDLYKMWFCELLHGQTTGGMPIPAAVLAQPTEAYIAQRMRDLGLESTLCVTVEALR